MANRTDGENRDGMMEETGQGQQVDRAFVLPDGTISIPQCEANLKSVDVADVDLLLGFTDGTFVIIPNGALDALSDSSHPVVFTDNDNSEFDAAHFDSDHESTLGDLFNMVGLTNVVEGGSLRVASENVDSEKPEEEEGGLDSSEGSVLDPSDQAILTEPTVKISKGGKGPGGWEPVESPFLEEMEDDAAPQITPRPSVYKSGKIVEDISDPTITLDPDITADDIVNIVEASGSITITGTVDNVQVGETVALTLSGIHPVTGNFNQTYLGTVQPGNTFSINVAGGELEFDADQIVEVSLAITDAAGNPITDTEGYGVDTVRPTASIVVADTYLTDGETSSVTITFSEAVVGFTNADLTVGNGTLSPVSSTDGGPVS